jgi:uncharacterized cupredoxin-like copper-binding protein
MYPTGVARAVSVFATAPSKVPLYLAGGLLAGWAVLVEGASSGAAAAAARSGSVQLTADPTGQLAFDRKRASVHRGKFTLRLINRSQIPHNVTSATANLPPGNYVFVRSVDAHRQAGMEGTLTVK